MHFQRLLKISTKNLLLYPLIKFNFICHMLIVQLKLTETAIQIEIQYLTFYILFNSVELEIRFYLLPQWHHYYYFDDTFYYQWHHHYYYYATFYYQWHHYNDVKASSLYVQDELYHKIKKNNYGKKITFQSHVL